MREIHIRVGELKARLSKYLQRVKAGAVIVITEQGRPVARIIPEIHTREERLRVMLQAGLIAWSGKKLEPMEPVVRTHEKQTVADLLIKNRE